MPSTITAASIWIPTTSPITIDDRLARPSDPTSSTVLKYLHSIATGERATRGGLTARDGTISMPTASGSLTPCGNSAELAFITSRRSQVARLNTNSPVASALICECLRGALEKIGQGG